LTEAKENSFRASGMVHRRRHERWSTNRRKQYVDVKYRGSGRNGFLYVARG